MKARALHFIGAALLTVLVGPNVFAGPPFFTDDPVPVDLHHWEIFFASQYQRTSSDRSGTAPHIDANYGAYPDLHVQVTLPAAFNRPEGEPAAYGYGDTELGVKYRFVQETDDRPQAAVFPAVVVPTGDSSRGLGNGDTQVFLPLWLQKSWGPWTTFGGGGYWFNRGAGQKDWAYAGWALQRDFSKMFTLGAELFHRTPDTIGGSSGTGFTIGGQLSLSKNYQLLLSMGRDFSGPNQFTRYLAFLWTF